MTFDELINFIVNNCYPKNNNSCNKDIGRTIEFKRKDFVSARLINEDLLEIKIKTEKIICVV